ncbi:MAG: hypothetical protein NZM12_11115 [Steroidobacteraceae bacterium]|nr:hypothetical protein [Steroidobacteraceae bacterium]MDW8257837.1 hypothetical protein [Gammaproteobacteria bacterium]
MHDPEKLRAHADRIRASNVLGRSGLIQRLFDFLVDCSIAGRVPKEVEVAIDVFGKSAGFEVAQDAMVRVYIHKLRRKLADYYAGPGRTEALRLSIPKGEYRLAFEEVANVPPIVAGAAGGARVAGKPALAARGAIAQRRWLAWVGGVLGLLLVANLLAWFSVPGSASPAMRELVQVRDHPIWRDLIDDDLPILVVLGDYYIFGELDERRIELRRLIREFDINSRGDLEQYLKNNPEFADRFQHVGLQYLPISVALVLQKVVPLLEPSHKSPYRVQIALVSELTPKWSRRRTSSTWA